MPPRRPAERASTLGRAIPLGRYAGVRVQAHWSVLVVLVLLAGLLAGGVLPASVPGRPVGLYWLTGVVAAAVFLATLLAHELAHALVALHFGMRVERITLWMLGGLTELGGEPPSPRADALVAAAGPAASLLLGVLFAAAGWLFAGSGLLAAALVWLAAVSLLLGVFNLLPGAPLDGGRLLRAVLWAHYRDRARAAQISARAGRGLGMFLIGLGVFELLAGAAAGLWLAMVGWFVLSGAAAEGTASRDERLRGRTVREVMTRPPTTAPSWWSVSEFIAHLGRAHPSDQAFALVDLDGHAQGVLSVRDLTRVRPDRRATTRLRDLSRGGPPPTATPDTPLVDVVPAIRLDGGIAVVVEDGRLIATLAMRDIEAAADRANCGLAAADHRGGSR